jgi:hypothetical protein
VNLYQYNGNDPNSFSDPFGLCPKEVGGDGNTASYSDCPKGTKGYDMVGRLGSPSVDPIGVAAAGIGGLIEGAIANAATAEVELASEGEATQLEFKSQSNHVDIHARLSPQEFENNLTQQGFTVERPQPGVRSFVKDATRYDMYPKATSTGGASVQKLVADVLTTKIRLLGGGQ